MSSRQRLGRTATRAVLLFGCALASLGCADSQARVFSVTVLESATIECEGIVNHPSVDEELVEQAATQTRRFWKNQKELYPPIPEGRVLHVIEVASGMRAWFEAPQQGGAGPTGIGASVFEGDIEDDYIEGDFEAVLNTDDDDEDAGRQLCGPRPYLAGKLLATDSGGSLLGRIQWESTDYIGTEQTSCAAEVVCRRDVDVWGALQ